MRFFLALAFLACTASMLAAAAPVCPSIPVQLELHTSSDQAHKFQLVFASMDPAQHYQQGDFVDIHYRINNEASVNLRVMTQDAITDKRQPAKQAQVDGITLLPGDALRAYATYSAKGYACDTPIHTFSAPEIEREFRNMAVVNDRNYRTRPEMTDRRAINYRQAEIDRLNEEYWTQAAAEESGVYSEGVCPSIPMDQDIVKIAGMDNTYMLSFENRNPLKQLHYVDLHISTDADKGWDNLRLASDMQLNLAHKVLQPGIVVKPNEQLKWYWSYRTTGADGQVIDCTTPVSQITPHQVTHEITLEQLNAAAHS